MSDTVKLVIEIPKKVVNECQEVYATQKCYGVKASEFETMIANGKPLSEVLAEIREEIKALDEGITSYIHDDPWIYKREALEVIDKHISGEECANTESTHAEIADWIDEGNREIYGG